MRINNIITICYTKEDTYDKDKPTIEGYCIGEEIGMDDKYNIKAYQIALNNTTYNKEGRAVISKDDEWVSETEWDDMFVLEQQKRNNKQEKE